MDIPPNMSRQAEGVECSCSRMINQVRQTQTDCSQAPLLNVTNALFFRHTASAGEIAILMMQPLLNTDDAGKSKLIQIKNKIYRDLWTVD